MLNIFYHPIYGKTKKVFLTRQLKHSYLAELFVYFSYKFNQPIPENLIQTGPHRRMRNLILTFKNDKEIAFNKFKYDNYYVLQYDEVFGKKIVEKIIKLKNNNKKLLIGPLYDLEHELEINELIKKYNFIKKLVASEIALLNTKEVDVSFDKKNAFVCPSGVASEKYVLNSIKSKEAKNSCLVYFKKRDQRDLEKVLTFLTKHKINYKLIKYGEFNIKKLRIFAKNSSFGVIISGTESQGFAIQELLSSNLPLFVWNKTINNYEGYKLSGTSVSYWNENCGVLVNSFSEFEREFFNFIKNLDKFKPTELVLEKLTFEKFNFNLKKIFLNYFE